MMWSIILRYALVPEGKTLMGLLSIGGRNRFGDNKIQTHGMWPVLVSLSAVRLQRRVVPLL